MKIRILSYNIHQGISLNRTRLEMANLKKALLSLKPDLVLLQEVAGAELRSKSKLWPEAVEGQLEALADKVWPHSAFLKNVIFTRHHHGNAILSRFPMSQVVKKNITVGRMKKRGFIHSTIAIPQGEGFFELHVINIHLGLMQFERLKQTKAICQYVRTQIPPQTPVVIAGDFNDWRKKVSLEFFGELGLHEAFLMKQDEHAKTFPSRFPVLHLDRIYYRGLEIASAHCLKGLPWKKMSDHLPVFADFKL